MSRAALVDVTNRLRGAGVIPADSADTPDELHDRPWFIALMQGFAGWLAGILLMVFIVMVFEPESRLALLSFGVVLLAAAWTIYRADPDAVFLDQLALAISIAGQIALVAGIVHKDASALGIAFTSLLLQIAVLFAMSNRTARTFAALFACIAWVYTVRFMLWPGEGEDVFFGYRPAGQGPLSEMVVLLGWLLTWIPLVGLGVWLIRREPRWMTRPHRKYARPMLTGLLLCLAAGGMATEPVAFTVLGSEAWGIHFTWYALFPLLSIGLAMLAAYGAFRLRSLGLLGVAILGALVHLSRFYYLYGTTLLAKSVIMLLVGAALLAAGISLHRRLSEGAR